VSATTVRFSTEHGLDQEFNSLDAQYEAASAYIKSQAHAGWTLIRSRYDDGGYSGGSTDRPDLQRLFDDIGSNSAFTDDQVQSSNPAPERCVGDLG
jgi:DNA invertase Pin-like site-specific DNA recombinase